LYDTRKIQYRQVNAKIRRCKEGICIFFANFLKFFVTLYQSKYYGRIFFFICRENAQKSQKDFQFSIADWQFSVLKNVEHPTLNIERSIKSIYVIAGRKLTECVE
jgi:hypothetical protein